MTTLATADPDDRQATLHVTGLTKTFGQGNLAVTAVHDLDLDVQPGEVVLIMGPSGSGKTTLLLMLGAMLRPTDGAIQVAGLDIASAPERRLPPCAPIGSASSSRTSTCLGRSAWPRTSSSHATSPALPAVPHESVPARCWNVSGSATGSASGPSSSQAGRSSAWRSPARSPTTRRSSWPTSPPPTSTPPSAARSPGCCASSPPKTAARW